MPTIRTAKSFLLGLLVVTSFSSFIMSIIQILKQTRYGEAYPPAVVAHLVAALLQCLFAVTLLASGGRGKMFTAKNVVAVNALMFLFNLGSMIAVTVLRFTDRYCGPGHPAQWDCRGVYKGTLGLGWSLIGLQIMYLCFVPFLVKKYGAWSEEMWNIPYVPAANADMNEKAPAH